MTADMTTNLRLVTRAIRDRRDRLADSCSNDDYTRDLINILDRITVSAGRRDITARILPGPIVSTTRTRIMATGALHAALDAVDGTVQEIDDLTVRLTLPANR